MGKVSIGLRGWRFEEAEVFAADGSLKALEEMPGEVATQVSRLAALVGSPCDACWLIHGDENLGQCDAASVVYGEPLSEVVLCDDHEDDFVYWFREAGGGRYRGEPELEDAFHEWFAAGNRAPGAYEGVEHVETDPENLPRPPEFEEVVHRVETPVEDRERIDLREMKVYTGEEATRSRRSGADGDDGDAEELDLEDADVDLSRDYPT